MGEDRRRYPRAGVGLDVTVEATGRQWRGKTLNLSPYGAKVALAMPIKLPKGTDIGLRLILPDGNVPLCLPAHVVRTDPDGVALGFGTLEPEQLQRLKHLVDSLLLEEGQEVLNKLGIEQPLKADARGSNPPLAHHTSLEDKLSVERGVQANETGVSRPIFTAEAERARSQQRSAAMGDNSSEKERLQGLLRRCGLENLHLPDGPLARHWRDFLRRLEVEE